MKLLLLAFSLFYLGAPAAFGASAKARAHRDPAQTVQDPVAAAADHGDAISGLAGIADEHVVVTIEDLGRRDEKPETEARN